MKYTSLFLIFSASILTFYYLKNIHIPTEILANTKLRSAVVQNVDEIENYRQSWVECSSFAVHAAASIIDTNLWSPSEIWSELWPKFSFWILPLSLQSYIKKHLGVYKIQWDIEALTASVALGYPVILLVEHQWYQHYFTVVWFDLDQDERYIYDSLVPRVDDVFTEDLNDTDPGNYSLSSDELMEKWNNGWRYGLWEMWGVALAKKSK